MAGRAVVGSVAVAIVPSAEGFVEKVRAVVDEAPNEIRINVKLDGTAEAEGELAALDAEAKKTGDSAGGAGSGISLMAGGIAAALPLLPELVGGLIAVSGAAFVAGSGLAGFGAVALADITNATSATQQLQAAQTAVNNATSNSARADALTKEQALITSLGPSTIALGQALNNLSGIWKSFAAGFNPEITRDVTAFASTLTTALPLIQPLITAGAGAVSTILTNLNTALQSPAAQQFFAWIAGAAEQDILGLTRAFGGFGVGILELFKAFAPLETLVVNGLAGMGTAFANWATHLAATQGFQQFLAYAAANGPLLVKTLEDIGLAAAKIVVAMMPLLPILLNIVDFVAQLIGSLNPTAILFGTLGGAALVAAGKLDIFAGSATAAGDAAGAAAGAGKLGLLSSTLLAIPGLAVAAGLAISKLSGGDTFGIGNTNLAGKTPDQIQAFLNSAGLGKFSVPGAGIGQAATDPASAAQWQRIVATVNDQTAGNLQSTFNSQVPGTIGSYFGNIGAAGGAPGGGTFNPPAYSLPNSATSAGSAAVNAALNNAQGLASLLGLNLMQALAQGITTGTNPLTQSLANINLKLTGPAQTIATALESSLSAAMSFGQAAAASLKFNVTSAPTVGSYTSIFMDAAGKSTTTTQSPLVGSAINALFTDQSFVSDIKKAKALGLSTELLGQFIQTGPSAAATLDALVNSGSSAIAQLNSTNAQIDALGNQYGYQTAADKYAPQIHADLQQVIGLLKQQPAATGQHVGAAITTGARAAQVKAASTPQTGAFARVR